MRRWAAVAAGAVVLTVSVPASARLGAGSLDPTFSGDGQAEAALGVAAYAMDVALQDGAVVVGVVADMQGSRGDDFALARFTHGGALDHTFGGGDGLVAVDVRDTDHLEAIGIQPDGKIVAVGWSLPTGFAQDAVLTVVRFRVDGALDKGFAGDGTKTVAFADGTDAYGKAIALFDDGRIAVAGGLQRDYGSRSEMFTVVLDKGGGLDPAFGKRRFDLGQTWAQADELQITGSGKLLVIGSAGPWYATDKTDLAVARLGLAGLDMTYGGGDGFALIDVRNDDRTVGSAQLSHGRLLILARTLNTTDHDAITFARLRGDGRRDRDWGGGDGVVSNDLFRTEYVWDVAVADDGKLVVVGWESEHPLVMRFKRDGSLDRSFGGDGIVDTSTPISDGDLTGVTLQPDGRIVACGTHRVEPTHDGIGAERLIA